MRHDTEPVTLVPVGEDTEPAIELGDATQRTFIAPVLTPRPELVQPPANDWAEGSVDDTIPGGAFVEGEDTFAG